MAWPNPLPAIRHEIHFGDRLVRCFAERPASLFAMLEQILAANPDGLALIEPAGRLTYAQLAERVDRLSATLAAHGVRAGDRVALLLGNGAPFLISLLACARLGAVAVPLSIREQQPGLAYMLVQSGSKLLIHEAEPAPRLPDLRALPLLQHRIAIEGRSFDALLAENPQPAPPVHRPAEEDVAAILYTSGTTGRPKGAMLTHLNIAHSVTYYALCLRLGSEDRALLATPANHVIGLVATLLTMVHVGGSTVLMRAFKARQLLELVAAERVTVIGMVPAMYHLCLLEPDLAAFDLSSWRIARFGGAPMPEATIARLAALLPHLQLMNAYGATETGAAITLMPFGHAARRPDSVGRAVPCAEVRIMDPSGREVPRGEPGEVWIKGPMVVPGYFANDVATRDAFVAGYWRSGDIGAIDEAGYLRVLDRLKDMINRAGYKVFSAEVENVLHHHPKVLEAAVVAHPDSVLGERVHAFVTARDGGLDVHELRAFCAARLADYKVPEFVTIGGEPLPRNAAGKVLKAALRERIAQEMA
ncbi:MAG: class I adenylate-forming enzyme family protein [Geminicoccaceae bacterium]